MPYPRAVRAVAVVFLVLGVVACESPAVPGAPCTRASECDRPLVCAFGFCRSECAENRDCPLGSACLLLGDGAGACGLETDLRCGDGIGRECPSGLVCAADRCQRVCGGPSDCPVDGECLQLTSDASFCFDPRGDADAGIPDASRDVSVPDAAQPLDAGSDAALLDAGTPAIGVLDVCVGETGGCAIGHDRRVYCWGSPENGRLGGGGDCTTAGTAPSGPVAVLGLTDAHLLACGDGFQCAFASGDINCWGRNDTAQLGRVTPSGCDATARPIATDTTGFVRATVGSISAAGAHTCASDQTNLGVVCWGQNDDTIDLLSPAPPASFAMPVDIAVVNGITPPFRIGQVSVAEHGVVARGDDAELYAWGPDDLGQRGSAITPLAGGVVYWSVGLRTLAVAAGRAHRCTLSTGFVASCWGAGGLGQLARDPLTLGPACARGEPCDPVPTAFAAARFSAIAARGDTTCGIVLGGTGDQGVLCWGANDHGQTGRAVSPFELGTDGSVVVRAPGAPLSAVRRIAVGPRAACAIDDQEALWCWGDFDFDAATAAIELATRVDVFEAP